MNFRCFFIFFHTSLRFSIRFVSLGFVTSENIYVSKDFWFLIFRSVCGIYFSCCFRIEVLWKLKTARDRFSFRLIRSFCKCLNNKSYTFLNEEKNEVRFWVPRNIIAEYISVGLRWGFDTVFFPSKFDYNFLFITFCDPFNIIILP